MNQETERVKVPANGRKPRKAKTPVVLPATVAASGEPAPSAKPVTSASPAESVPAAKATSPELTIAVTPGQIAVGFGVIAGIILLVLGRHRGRRKR